MSDKKHSVQILSLKYEKFSSKNEMVVKKSKKGLCFMFLHGMYNIWIYKEKSKYIHQWCLMNLFDELSSISFELYNCFIIYYLRMIKSKITPILF